MKIEAEIDKVVDYRIRSKKKKPFVLECRFLRWWPIRKVRSKWKKWSAYATKRDMDNALANLQGKHNWVEYRIKPNFKNI